MHLPERLKEASRLLFHFDQQARLNLFEAFPVLERFLRDRQAFAYLRTAGDIVFTIVIVLGLFGPQDPERNVALFIAWGVWWTSVVLSWFFAGRFWCGLCPFPGLGRILRRFGLSMNLDVPDFLKKRGLHLSTVFLAGIIWAESVFNLKNSPAGTASLLLVIIAGATLMEVLYKGQAWCRHLCPMGRIIGAAATLSMTEFRPDQNICRTCSSAACRKGQGSIPGCPVYLGAVNVRNNLDCLVCGHCVPLCPHGSPRINLRSPFTELIINKGRYLTCSYIIPFLMGSQIARFVEEKPWVTPLRDVFAHSNLLIFSALLAAGFLLFFGIMRLGARLFVVTQDEIFGRFSPLVPVIVPLAFTGELVYRLQYFLSSVGEFVPTLGRQAGIDLSSWGFNVGQNVISGISLLTLIVGVAACHQALRLFYRGDFEGMVPRANYAGLHALVFSVFLAYVILF
jgi:hypothetical protein